ncbi:MAG: hypothetical protein GY794_25725, partial [bacterium]|nr:hypothetical protein [bacterium]
MQSKITSIIMLVALMFVTANVTAASQIRISNVTVKNALFRPIAGEESQISFYLSQDAELVLTIFDADDYAVRTLGTEKPGFKGVNTVSWNGRDDRGSVVADDAYYVVIEANTSDGAAALYDPTSLSGGEKIPVDAVYRSGHITYHLPKDARVRIRIGVPKGPLLRTLVDWEPRRAGPQAEPWDGKDDSDILQDFPFLVTLDAFALPQHSLFTTGSGTDPIEHTFAARGRAALAGGKQRQKSRVMAPGQESHAHAAMPRSLDRAPRFRISLAGDTEQTSGARSSPTVSGDVRLTVNLEEVTGIQLA